MVIVAPASPVPAKVGLRLVVTVPVKGLSTTGAVGGVVSAEELEEELEFTLEVDELEDEVADEFEVEELDELEVVWLELTWDEVELEEAAEFEDEFEVVEDELTVELLELTAELELLETEELEVVFELEFKDEDDSELEDEVGDEFPIEELEFTLEDKLELLETEELEVVFDELWLESLELVEVEDEDEELELPLPAVTSVGAEVLPAGSVWVTWIVVPGLIGEAVVQDQVPSGWTNTGEFKQAIGLLLLSTKAMIAPASPVPLTVLVGAVVIGVTAGAAGEVWSTFVVAGAEVDPLAGLVWVATIGEPLAGVETGVQDHVPFDWTTTGEFEQAIGFPLPFPPLAPSVRSTTLPGVPKPVIGEPSVGLMTGAAGAVINSLETVVVTGVEGLRLGRLAVATTVVPGVNGAVSSQTYCPFPAATTGEFEQAIGLLEPSTKVIVAPGWAVPVMTWSALLTGLIVGVWVWLGTAGGVGLTALESATVVCAGPLWLPAGSIALAVTTLPWASGEAKLQV
jgi:hypothetical protein